MRKLICASWLIFAAAILCCGAVKSNKELSKEEFLARSRRTSQVNTYARLAGTLQHRRRGRKLESMPIYFGIIMHKNQTVGQILLNRNEGYLINSLRGSNLIKSTPMPTNKSSRLGDFGIRATDLTLSFLFCKPEKEFEPETVSGVVPCRVLLLDDSENREKIKVWISTEHCFPLQAEFYKYGENKPYRLLEASGFTQKNQLYYVKRIRVEGPGWRTRVEFSSADLAVFDNPMQVPQVIVPIKE